MNMKKYVAPELEVVLLGDGAGMIIATSDGDTPVRPGEGPGIEGGYGTVTSAAMNEWATDLMGAYQAAQGNAAANGSVWTNDAADVDGGASEGLASEVMMPELTESSGIISEGLLPDVSAAGAVAPAPEAPVVDAVPDWTDGGAAAEDAPSSEFGAE